MAAEPSVVFVWSRRQLAFTTTLTVATIILAVVAAAAITGSGPLDYRAYAWFVGLAAILGILLSVPAEAIYLVTRPRVSVVLSHSGISGSPAWPRDIPWSEVMRIRTMWLFSGRYIRLELSGRRRLRPTAPQGRAWLPDPEFGRAVAAFQRFAREHGVPVQPRVEDRRWVTVAATSVAVAVVAAAVARIADRGVTWPWTPTATGVAAACVALDAAGLDAQWPPGTRTPARSEPVLRADNGYESSRCTWNSSSSAADPAPFNGLSVTITRYRADLFRSAVGHAASAAYSGDRLAVSRSLPAIGDEAIVTGRSGAVDVWARRANVTVSLSLRPGDAGPLAAEDAARTLTEQIVAGIDIR